MEGVRWGVGRAERLGLGGGLFTVVAGDKIDHNLISLTAKSLFYGAAIPLMQFPTDDHPGIECLL